MLYPDGTTLLRKKIIPPPRLNYQIMTDQPIIPSDERKDYHQDHTDTPMTPFLAQLKKTEDLWQTLAGIKMLYAKHISQEDHDRLKIVLDNNKPY